HPERVLAMVLRGSFLARRQDLAWFAGEGAHRLLPAQWQRFLDASGLVPGPDLTRQVHAAVLGEDESRAATVALAWESWSTAVVMYSLDGGDPAASSTVPAALPAPDPALARGALVKARLEMHYARHGYFLRENQLLEDAGRLPKVPTVIVHGARDITCPAEAAWSLHRALPGSRLEILRTAGHLSSEAPMVDALVRAADEVAAALAAR
ncbi:MAG: prolyl aminopeptidase, partial [Gammaproteobacteria bacterium]